MTGWVTAMLRETEANTSLPLSTVRGLALSVRGIPGPQGSKRHVGHGVMIESSLKVKPWREAVMGDIARAGYHTLRIDRPVAVRITFLFTRPKSHFLKSGLRPNAPTYKTSAPDIDKLCRSTYDALVQGGMLKDDSRIVIQHTQKVYWEWSGAMISVDEVTGP